MLSGVMLAMVGNVTVLCVSGYVSLRKSQRLILDLLIFIILVMLIVTRGIGGYCKTGITYAFTRCSLILVGRLWNLYISFSRISLYLQFQ